MKANTIERAEWTETIARQLRKCKTQREAIKIAASIVYEINAPTSIHAAGEKFKDALCELYEYFPKQTDGA